MKKPDKATLVELEKKWKEREKMGMEEGEVIIKGKETPFELMEQGYIREMNMPGWRHTASDNIQFHLHRIPVHSGKHVHQGGYSLFVVQGKGYTVVDGVRHDWEDGDLILLPYKAGGVEHQHFNRDAKKPAIWLAMVSRPLREIVGRRTLQREVSPDWLETQGNKVSRFEDQLSH